jgi:hypothetical protein
MTPFSVGMNSPLIKSSFGSIFFDDKWLLCSLPYPAFHYVFKLPGCDENIRA